MTSVSSSSNKTNNSIEDHDHHTDKVNKIQYAGDNQEYVIINRQKYYRHELMAAFGGYLNPGASPYPKININPAPLGLSAFATTTFVLSLINAQAMGITVPNVVVSLACFYGGAVQFLAGCIEFVTGNTFGFTALTSYGAFWLSYAAIFIESFDIAASYTDSQELENAVGFFLIGWAIFTLILFLNTLKSTVAFSSLFFFLFVTFLLLGGGAFSGHVGVTRAGGVIGVITAFIAWYNAFAGTATRYNSYITARPIPLPGNFLSHKWEHPSVSYFEIGNWLFIYIWWTLYNLVALRLFSFSSYFNCANFILQLYFFITTTIIFIIIIFFFNIIINIIIIIIIIIVIIIIIIMIIIMIIE